MGVVETVGAVATAITAIVGLGIMLWKQHRANQAQERANAEAELAVRIQAAKSDAERKKLSEELHRLRNR